MKRYIGRRSLGTVLVNNKPLKHIIKHSPTGMEWGYGGSGPADLALSILTDYLSPESANRYYQDFKWAFIAKLGDDWVITESEIQAWLKRR